MQPSAMDSRLADEVLLRILSFLDAADLVRLQLVNTHICRLAKDPQLWKRLFYFNFVRPNKGTSDQHASSRTLPTLRELRSLLLHQNLLSGKHITGDGAGPIHRLPSRYYSTSPRSSATIAPEKAADDAIFSLFHRGLRSTEASARDHLIDWEQIFRVSTNWQHGNFAVSELVTPTTRARLAPRHLPSLASHGTIVRVSHEFTLTATTADVEDASTSPSVSVYPSEPSTSSADQLGQTTSYIPTDLQDRRPILRFSSQRLRRLLEIQSSDQDPKQVLITEIAIDADAGMGTPSADALESRKRKVDGTKDIVSGSVARVLIAYSTGHFSIFSLRTTNGITKCSEDVFDSSETTASDSHVTMAALHSHALVLCSSDFQLAFYRIRTNPTTRIDLIHRVSSYRCSWPASLRLKKLPYHDMSKSIRGPSSSLTADRHWREECIEEQAFRVTFAYSTPSYPASWSVSVLEVVVRLNLDAASPSAVRVTSRHATAKHPFRPTPIDPRGRSMLGRHQSSPLRTSHESLGQPPVLASRVATTSSRSTSLTYDDPFVVLGASDNLIEVYELLGATTFVRRTPRDSHTPAPTSRSATATPASPTQGLRLVHRRSLHGHTGSVDSVALEDGRCVSGGADGSVMVWSLGDRANETDSVASVMRHVRASARGSERRDGTNGIGSKSTSSTILDQEEGDEAATHMAHVLTLRSSMEPELSESELRDPNDKHSGYNQARDARPLGPSLGQMVRSRVLDRQTRGVIRWVSTAFDKIVSIVAYTDAMSGLIAAGNSSTEAQQPRERVQVWSFG
ncbi:hypothetical protein EX895_000214 [Sporisorium graminicola]|uniref:F-box domain-containing protein n=1 Tax=Sporisorium graminicola TaxID=280036 RepID=A0A4U7L0I8_9BASI|nr:hypothetical protein EX895_000214 [Sporisorium graminicola]TKY90216.1 hypothetical protein EX895_000214 [Sporisorium graminicola]